MQTDGAQPRWQGAAMQTDGAQLCLIQRRLQHRLKRKLFAINTTTHRLHCGSRLPRRGLLILDRLLADDTREPNVIG
tara:strand:- start:76 stop:306 length:231 start_codon:yes stop_codon:yes gene_type:complete